MCSCRHKCARSGVTIIPSSRSALNAPHGNTGQQGDACDGERGAYSRCDWGGKNTMVRFDAQGCPEDCIGRETWNLWAPPRPAPPSEQSPSFSRLTRRRRGARRWALEDSKPMGCSMKYSGCVNIFKFICLLRPRFTGKFPT